MNRGLELSALPLTLSPPDPARRAAWAWVGFGFGHGGGHALLATAGMTPVPPAPAAATLRHLATVTALPTLPILPLLLAVLVSLALALLWRRRAARTEHRCARLDAALARATARHARDRRALSGLQASLDRLAAEVETARQAERARIGRDIHDDLGQHLLALQLDIGSLHASPRLPAPLRQHTARLEGQARATIAALRAVIDDLRPAALAHGLRQAARCQLDDFARLSGLRCHLRTVGLDQPASGAGNVESALYRLLQEALSNVLRHAAASEVHVTLARDAGGFRLAVHDNGVGLRPGGVRHGAGLAGMADRVAAAGGRMTLDGPPGRGTTVAVTLPAGPVAASRHAPATADCAIAAGQ